MKTFEDYFPLQKISHPVNKFKLINYFKSFNVDFVEGNIIDIFSDASKNILQYSQFQLIFDKNLEYSTEEQDYFDLKYSLDATYDVLWNYYNDPLYRAEALSYLTSQFPHHLAVYVVGFVSA